MGEENHDSRTSSITLQARTILNIPLYSMAEVGFRTYSQYADRLMTRAKSHNRFGAVYIEE